MKCTECGADSVVLSTRKHKKVFLIRRRSCFNEHRFSTLEIPAGSEDAAVVNEIAAAIAGMMKTKKVNHAEKYRSVNRETRETQRA